MKTKLIKEAGGYDLYRIDEDGKRVTFASTQDYKQKLSLKNCQAIERGYDLDELADEHAHKTCEDMYEQKGLTGAEWGWETASDFKKGFQKCLELMGDKKFSEEDLRLAMHFGRFGEANNQTTTIGFIQSLQQTEWDVEIEMDEEKKFIFDPAMGISQGYYLDKPKLDADGFLILRKK